MKTMWDARYGEEKFAFGEAPNDYLKEKLEKKDGQKILFPAEGEGRNAVYAATLGWNSSAFDLSGEGLKKAQVLANKHDVSIDYQVGELSKINYTKESFDAIVLVYAHFPAHLRREYHQLLGTYLKPGGRLILEGFSKNNLELSQKQEASNGPKDINMLFSTEEIEEDFQGYKIIELKEEIITLDEGPYHQGEASVIRLYAIKE